MTKSPQNLKKSNEALETAQSSVFDFLFVDFERIASFVSQFNEFGNLDEVLHTRSAGRESSSNDSVQISGNAAIVKGEGKHDSGYSAHHESQSQRSYDSRWLAPLSFLDEISQRGLLNRDMSGASPGQLVLVKGPLKIRELSTLHQIWNQPTVKKLMKAGAGIDPAGNRHARRKERATGASKETQTSEIDLFFEVVDVIPHTLQSLIGDQHVAWSILEPKYLIGNPADFALKYGGNIPGEWAVVGVLDAPPNFSPLAEGVVENPELAQMVDAISRIIEPIARQYAGRPETAYALTPLVIFREVGNAP